MMMASVASHFSQNMLCPTTPSSFTNPSLSTNASLLLPIGAPVPCLAAFPSSFLSTKSPNPFSPVNSLPPLNSHYISDEDEDEGEIQGLRVPDGWSVPSKALEESEWLRVSLHKWLDDEYCPEETNVDISKVAASSYYKSLLEKRTDLGDILLKMARALESISYQDSFHGAFSSANAAIDLIAQRIEQSPPLFSERNEMGSVFSYLKHRTQVTIALRAAGLESANLIIGIDFTKSNEWSQENDDKKSSIQKLELAYNWGARPSIYVVNDNEVS